MTKQLFIITGTSRGLGLALAEKLAGTHRTLLCVARTTNPQLVAHAEAAGAVCDCRMMDLTESATAAEWMRSCLQQMREISYETATLINNAAALARTESLGNLSSPEIIQTLRIGLEVPMLLTSVFLHETRAWRTKRRVLNISSGFGRRPVAAVTPYAAAKAGMDHFTRCLAVEEQSAANPALLCSLAPGTIDTGMQEILRKSDPAAFPEREKFVQFYQDGGIPSADIVAERIISFLESAEFGVEAVDDLSHPKPNKTIFL